MNLTTFLLADGVCSIGYFYMFVDKHPSERTKGRKTRSGLWFQSLWQASPGIWAEYCGRELVVEVCSSDQDIQKLGSDRKWSGITYLQSPYFLQLFCSFQKFLDSPKVASPGGDKTRACVGISSLNCTYFLSRVLSPLLLSYFHIFCIFSTFYSVLCIWLKAF